MRGAQVNAGAGGCSNQNLLQRIGDCASGGPNDARGVMPRCAQGLHQSLHRACPRLCFEVVLRLRMTSSDHRSPGVRERCSSGVSKSAHPWSLQTCAMSGRWPCRFLARRHVVSLTAGMRRSVPRACASRARSAFTSVSHACIAEGRKCKDRVGPVRTRLKSVTYSRWRSSRFTSCAPPAVPAQGDAPRPVVMRR